MSDLPYPDEPERTHWEGCYREAKHHNCAVAEVDRLGARLAEVEAENGRLRSELQFYGDEWCNYSKDDFDSYGGGHRGPSPALSRDKGERARAALALPKESSDDDG